MSAWISQRKRPPVFARRLTRPKALESPLSMQPQLASYVGILVSEFKADASGRLLEGAADVLSLSGYQAVVHACKSNDRRDALQAFFDLGCEGIILNGAEIPIDKLADMLDRHRSLVVANRYVKGFDSRCVYVDRAMGARLAARQLLHSNHEQIAMITGPAACRDSVACTAAFIDELTQHGVYINRSLIVEGLDVPRAGFDAFDRLRSTRKPFSAVFTQNDALAIGVMEACTQRGIRVPADLSVLAVDNQRGVVPSALHKHSSICLPNYLIGERVARLLVSLISPMPGQDHTAYSNTNFGGMTPELVDRFTVRAPLDLSQLDSLGESLTTREKECLGWIANGKTSSEIAILLSIAESTVNFHLKNTFGKLNASNRSHAVAKAVSLGLVDPV